jgi:ElaB/YqjD/DUF883 family membrane-anchored ribosome-binding protein
MINRIPDDLLASGPQIPSPSTTSAELLQAAQKQFDDGRRRVETYIQEHPAAGISAALCIGVLIGWYSKRR